MGGIATAAQIGLGAVNLINANRTSKQKIKYDDTQQKINNQNRKNLLEEQLASRRAALSAMGLSSGKSALAVQNRLIDDTYDDIKNNTLLTEQRKKTADEERRTSLTNNLLGLTVDTASKLIK